MWSPKEQVTGPRLADAAWCWSNRLSAIVELTLRLNVRLKAAHISPDYKHLKHTIALGDEIDPHSL